MFVVMILLQWVAHQAFFGSLSYHSMSYSSKQHGCLSGSDALQHNLLVLIPANPNMPCPAHPT
jgi:hypothetical protein